MSTISSSGVGNIVAAIAYFALFFIHTENMAVYIIGFLPGYFGIDCFNGVIRAMIVDVIDADEVKRGTRRIKDGRRKCRRVGSTPR